MLTTAFNRCEQKVAIRREESKRERKEELHPTQLSGHVDGFIEIDRQPTVQMAKDDEQEDEESEGR